MTKIEEIQKLQEFVGRLEDGYLKDIFDDLGPMIINAIQSDFCCVPYREMQRTKMDLQSEIRSLEKQASDLKVLLSEGRRQQERLKTEIDDIRRIAATIAACR
jgi:predicted RNase H-like nuclease (RuvC/YqgF family)